MTILHTIIALSFVGVLSAIILYFVAKKFHIDEDPRIAEVEDVLPSVNCGACGYPGCRHFAEACVKADKLGDLFCPVGGNDCMANVAKVLGQDAVVKDPLVAVLRCNGSPEHCAHTNAYDGTPTCAIAHSLYIGETGCKYGCLGLDDCVVSCKFDAMYMDKKTGLPVILEDKCTACGACIKACPRDIIELRKKGPKGRRVYVNCINMDKGAVAMKACKVACIACGKCVEACPFEAITMDNNLAYIDFEKCKLCRKCVIVCPTNAIIETNFPPRKPAEPEAAKAETDTDKAETKNEQ